MRQEAGTKTPILNTLEDYLSHNPLRMHVPFHAGIANNPVFPKGLYDLDISEVSGYDIEGEDNPLFQSEQTTAKYFNVYHSFYLTGGASVGLLGALVALNKYGKKVIVARNVHKSVINGLVLSGLEPIWLEVDFLNEWGIFSRIDLNKLKNIVNSVSDCAGCILVSPTYEGIITDIKAVSEICHEKNIPLVVDEAHGSHLYCLNELNLYSSVQLGVDLVIQSWHKSLGSLTQTGVLHLVKDVYFSYKDIKRSLDLVSSTSPSFLLLLSLELTRKHLAFTGGNFFKSLCNNAMLFKNSLNDLSDITVYGSDDPLKVYFKCLQASGIDFAYELYKQYALEVESANDIGLLMQIGVNFNDVIMNKALDSVKSVISQQAINKRQEVRGKRQEESKVFVTASTCSPREAFLKGFKKENVEYQTDIKAPCPPGYAISIPGMRIDG